MAAVCMMVNDVAGCIAQEVTDRVGANHPLGPMAWANRVGMNFIRNALSNMQRENDPGRYRCPALFEAWAGGVGEGFPGPVMTGRPAAPHGDRKFS